MFKHSNENVPIFTKNDIVKLKGQAVPLLSYHIIRDYVLSVITGEHQSSILYWVGKDLAHHFQVKSFEECSDLFLELGWGTLELKQSSSKEKIFVLESPFFQVRQALTNKSTFSLECGFLTEILSILEGKDTEGEYDVIHKNQQVTIEIKVFLQERKEALSKQN